MSVEVDYSGFDMQLAELAAKTASGGRKAAKAGAQIVAETLKKNTPLDPNTKYHMKDDIEVSKVSSLDEYEVHYGKDTAWRSKFVNDGTIYITGQHFAEKTEREAEEPAKAAMEKVIYKESKGI